MRAEGGEAIAIINRRNTRRYKKILPDVIESFNRGIFEEKYLSAFHNTDNSFVSFNKDTSVDLSRLEDSVNGIRKQGEIRTTVMPDGTVIMYYKNIKRIIRKS